jgi:hypothetical protein
MVSRLPKVLPLMICALMALPAAAGERYQHRDRGNFHFASGQQWFGDRDRRHGHNRYVRLRHFSPGSNGYGIRSVVASGPGNEGPSFNGTYAGSYAYDVDGGTYIGASGYAAYGMAKVVPLAPKAKIIDVAVQDDPCEYEANVCVIRP